jgi:hypothetical protein
LKRLAVFLGLNAIVSIIVTLAVLWVWDATHRDTFASLPPAPTAVVAAGNDATPGGEQPAG